MQRTLLAIPHEIAGLPVFGVGWLLIFAAAGFLFRVVWGKSRDQSFGQILANEGLIWGILAAAIIWVLPKVELRNVAGEPIGMAIRGYGVMLLSGVAASVGLAYYRAKRAGQDPDVILSMAPWAFIGGIIGARLFFVIQYRDRFIGDTVFETLGNALRFTEGGLVVYGSFIGGFVALTYFVLRNRLPWLTLGDVIVPCLFLGVFFGRVGCLMNGCCYGGRCEDNWYALYFPATSPVYKEQMESGALLGFRYDPDTRRIESVEEGSLADKAGIQAGSTLELLANDRSPLPEASTKLPIEDIQRGVIATVDGRRYRWSPEELPDRALPVVPAQLISSLSGLTLCLLLCAIPLNRFRPGTIMMLGFAGYALMRFGLEIVRVDESGQFGTTLSISQWVSIVVLGCCVIGFVLIYCFSGVSVSRASVPEKS
ncbi:MAG: prolipoprotein diacylglyceryl transferase family protein [Planctomycetota bacterium]